jgi:hypothetical protein
MIIKEIQAANSASKELAIILSIDQSTWPHASYTGFALISQLQMDARLYRGVSMTPIVTSSNRAAFEKYARETALAGNFSNASWNISNGIYDSVNDTLVKSTGMLNGFVFPNIYTPIW